MINFVYNNNSYTVDEHSSINTCLTREDLISLPLVEWDKLLTLKAGTSEPYILYNVLLTKIAHYDKSNEVNSFIYKENKYWLDKNTRMSLMNLANCTNDSILLVLNDQIITIEHDKLVEFLKQLEVYASKCYVNTLQHLITAKALRLKKDIINYDYTSGYPDKIVLE